MIAKPTTWGISLLIGCIGYWLMYALDHELVGLQ